VTGTFGIRSSRSRGGSGGTGAAGGLGGAGGAVCGWLNAVSGIKLTAIRMMAFVFIFVLLFD
jgi:hypothetical protein